MSSDHLDKQVLEKLRSLTEFGDEVDFLDDLIITFIKDVIHWLGPLKIESANLNAPVVERIAHRLKGSSRVIGAAHMAGLLNQLEKSANVLHTKEFAALVTSIETEFFHVKTTLETQWLTQSKAA